MNKKHESSTSEDIRNFIASAIVCDHTFPVIGSLEAELQDHREAGFTHVSVTIATDEPSYELAEARISMFRSIIDEADGVVFANAVSEIRSAHDSGKLSVGFHFQGTEPLQRDIGNVRRFRELGVGWMLLAYNWQNNAAVGCIEAVERDYGLSQFGKNLVGEMNAGGMIVDLAHTGAASTFDAMEISAKPCMFSHANIRDLFEHPRNLTDDQIRAVVETDGLVGITGVGEFVGEFDRVRPETVFRHVDWIVQRHGDRHVGLGLDFMSGPTCDAVLQSLDGQYERNGMSPPPWRFLPPGSLTEIVGLMRSAGYSDQSIQNVLGENFLRVAKECWLEDVQ